MRHRFQFLGWVPMVWAVCLFAGVPSASAQEAEAPARHVDLEIGVGAHVGVEENTPLNDDLYTGLGLAAQLSDHVDFEAQASYLTGRDFDGDDAPGAKTRDSRNGFHFNGGFRYYPWSVPSDRARFYFSGGAGVILDYRENDDVTPAVSLGVGLRVRAGDRTGFLLRVPFLIMADDKQRPSGTGQQQKTGTLIVPTLNFFYQF